MDDKKLILQVARGDQQAFLQLYERHASRVYTLILHMTQDEMMAEEVLQEVFLKLWRRAGQYRPERGEPMAWLLTIAHRSTLERLRAESRRPVLFDGDEPSMLLENLPEPESTSEEARWHSLHLVVQSLPVEQKQVIQLAYYQGLSQRQIAEMMHVPLGTVKTRLRAGMIRLRRAWLEDETS